MRFRYTVIDQQQREFQGELDVDDIQRAKLVLMQQGYQVRSIEPVSEGVAPLSEGLTEVTRYASAEFEKPEIIREETTHRKPRAGRRWMMRLAIVASFIVLSIVVIDLFVLPYYITRLPNYIDSSSRPYKQIIQGNIEYLPPADLRPVGGLSDIPIAGEFGFVASTDVVPHSGMEGILRIGIGQPWPFAREPEISLGYRVIEATTTPDLYLILTSWPKGFQQVIPDELSTAWLRYDVDDTTQAQSTVASFLSFLKFPASSTSLANDIGSLWSQGLARGILSWQFGDVFYKDESGGRVVDIVATLNPTILSRNSKAYAQTGGETIQRLARLLGFDSGVRMLEAVDALKVRMRVGVSDRRMHGIDVDVSLQTKKTGRLTVALTSLLFPIDKASLIETPLQASSANEIIQLLGLLANDDDFIQAALKSSFELSTSTAP